MGVFMRSIVLAAGLAILLGAPVAGAADLYVPEPVPYEEPAPVVQASGWYLRGDVSYDFNDMDGAHYYPGGGRADFTSTDLDDSWNLGVGAGYQINNWLRTDVTGDYMFKADFEGTTAGTCPGGGPCSSVERSSVSLLSLLANAYVDLGTYSGITPYIGAGIGGTHVDWDDFNGTTNCGVGCSTTSSYNGKSSWRFTYALMAGASVDLTCNLKLDAGYRYRHIEGGPMFDGLAGTGAGFDDGFDVHEVRGGLRYTFGGCAQPPVYASYEPAPVYK